MVGQLALQLSTPGLVLNLRLDGRRRKTCSKAFSPVRFHFDMTNLRRNICALALITLVCAESSDPDEKRSAGCRCFAAVWPGPVAAGNSCCLRDFCGIITGHGYLCNETIVATPDGYNLGVYRMSTKAVSATAPVVLLWHGLAANYDKY